MKVFILSLFLTVLSLAQVDSMRVTWVDPTASDLDSIRIYADTTASPITWRGSVAEAIEYYEWQPPYTGLWRVRTRAMDDSSNLSSYSSIDTVTIGGAVSGFDPSDLNPLVDLRYGVGMTKDATSGNVTTWTDGTYAFINADTASAPWDNGDALYFVTAEARVLSRNNTDDAFDLTEAQDFTIEIWANITNIGRVFHNRGSAPYWVFAMAAITDTNFRMQLNNGSANAIIDADTVIVVREWHHYVVKVDWGVGADIYIDGDLKISEHITEWTAFTTAGQSEPTYIGRSDNPEGFGYVSDIRLYPSALSYTDIANLFNFGRSQ